MYLQGIIFSPAACMFLYLYEMHVLMCLYAHMIMYTHRPKSC